MPKNLLLYCYLFVNNQYCFIYCNYPRPVHNVSAVLYGSTLFRPQVKNLNPFGKRFVLAWNDLICSQPPPIVGHSINNITTYSLFWDIVAYNLA